MNISVGDLLDSAPIAIKKNVILGISKKIENEIEPLPFYSGIPAPFIILYFAKLSPSFNFMWAVLVLFSYFLARNQPVHRNRVYQVFQSDIRNTLRIR